MIDLITGIGFLASVLIFGAFTVLYDVLGGIAVIWSDVLQMAILVSVLGYLLWLLAGDAGGLNVMLSSVSGDRLAALDFFGHHGLGDGHDFAFWPMLIGGFLCVSYGCDQSQVQRQLVPKTKRWSDDPAAEWFAAFSAGLALLPDRRRYRGLRRKSVLIL